MIIVTGANGFIGSAIVWQLNQAGITDIVAADIVSSKERPGPLSKRKYLRLLGKEELLQFLQLPEAAKSVSLIVHMGANSSTTETNWDHLYENNTLYSQKLFEWCTQHGKDLIYASSAATYGAGEQGYSDKMPADKLLPLNLYGKSKLMFDSWVEKQTKTPPHWYGLKFFNVYGPNEYHKGPMASLVYKAYHQVNSEGQLKLFKSHRADYKDGEQMRDFVYVKDVTKWILDLVEKKPASGIYNMGYGKARTWLDLAKPIFSSMKTPEKIQFIDMPSNIRDQYQYFTEAEMQKWESAGMAKPTWPVEKGVQDYVEQYLLKTESYL